MSRTSEQIRHMLQSSQRWNAGLQWYDFLLAIAFHQDGTGEMMYGENQRLRSDLTFRYEIAADMQIHFEFFGLPPYRGKMFARTKERAFKAVAFHL
jgi:hypothetical protein